METFLDHRIGMVHATNNRSHSLNLDFADIFKPIAVDRVIFSLINTHQLKADIHFEKSKEGGVYLSNVGKRIFIEQFEQKMSDVLAIDGINYTYKRLMHREVNQFLQYVKEGQKYKPYKYY